MGIVAALAAALGSPIAANAAVTGTWESYGPGAILEGGRLRGLVYSPDGTKAYISFTQRFPEWGDAPSQMWSGTFPGTSFTPLSTTGYDKSQPLWTWPGMSPGGQPLMIVGEKGPVYRYNGTNWQQATIPPGETTNWRGYGVFQTMSDGGILLLARYSVLRSTDDGLTYTTYSNITPFTVTPPPLGPDHYPTRAHYLTNAPTYANYGYNFLFQKMPWEELVIGGESDCFYNSLDGGLTWERMDPRLDQPQRDASGVPWYQNRRFAYAPGGNLITAGYNKDGEVILGSDRNATIPIYRLTPGNIIVPMSDGLGNEVGGTSSHLVSTPNGEIYFWTGYGVDAAPPGHSPNEVFAWDGTAWNFITPLFEQGFISTAILGTDGTSALVASGPGIKRFVSHNTTIQPRVALGPAQTVTFPNPATLAGTVDQAGTWTWEWTARQPERVTFSNPAAATTQAWFTSPGNYVVNCQATNGTLRGGNCVIVRVLPQPGAIAPTIATHPSNALLTPGGNASFSVVASPASTGPLSYQWFKDGTAIPGANSSTLSFTAAANDTGAAYACLVSGPGGRILSNSGTLGNPPSIILDPAAQSVASGQAVSFTVCATGTTPLQWQWYQNGLPIPSTGGQQCAFSTVAPASIPPGGLRYSVKVTNLFGSVTSAEASLTLGTATPQVFRAIGIMYDSSGSYAPGTQVAVTAPLIDPVKGGIFMGWNKSGGGVIANPTSRTTWVTLPATVGTTIFISPAYANPPSQVLTIANGLGGGLYSTGNVVPIQALPAPPGYVFDHWATAGGPTLGNANSPSTTAMMSSSSAVRVAAVYSALPAGVGAHWSEY